MLFLGSSLVPHVIALLGVTCGALLFVTCLCSCGAHLLQSSGASLHRLLYSLGGALLLIGRLSMVTALSLVLSAALGLVRLRAFCLVLNILFPEVFHLTVNITTFASIVTLVFLSAIVLVVLLPSTGDSNNQTENKL